MDELHTNNRTTRLQKRNALMYSRKKLRSGSTTCSPENNVNMVIKRRDDYYLPSFATCGEKKRPKYLVQVWS